MNYVDMDGGPQARDYTCGSQTYDGHGGTDFAVRHEAAMRQGVAVRASAPGVVKARRDGVADRRPGEQLPREPGTTACGNGVIIDHGEGWETQYCHLRQGSLRVRQGERVERGATLGLVGRSGHAAFAHLHFALRRSGELLDPFVGGGPAAGCGGPRQPHWSAGAADALRYRPASIFDAGIAGDAITPEAAYGEGEAVPARRDSRALVAWAALFGVRAGDELQLSLLAADGTVLARSRRVLERNQARYFVYAGRKRAGELWPAGEYRVEVELVRAMGGGGAPFRAERRTRANLK